MTTTPTVAIQQSSKNAALYTRQAMWDLCGMLNIDRTVPRWQDQLAPFAGVWAAMVTASTFDYQAAVDLGSVKPPA